MTLNTNDTKVLTILAHHPQRATEIANKMGIDCSGVQRVLKRLERSNKVHKHEIIRYGRSLAFVWAAGPTDKPIPVINTRDYTKNRNTPLPKGTPSYGFWGL